MSAARSTLPPAPSSRATRRGCWARTWTSPSTCSATSSQNSVFDEAELAREKNVILQEYAAVEDTPDDLVYDAFVETAFAGQAIGRPILGRPETIRSFDGGMIRAFMAREYAPERMVLAAAGAVDHDAIVGAAERQFGGASRTTFWRRLKRPIRAASGGWRAGSNRPTS